MSLRTEKPEVLIVDDDPDMLELTVEGLTLQGFAAQGAGSPEEAVEKMRAHRFAAVVADLHLPRTADGETLCVQAGSLAPGTAIFLLSGDRAVTEIAARHGVSHIFKPAPPSEIARHLTASLSDSPEVRLER